MIQPASAISTIEEARLAISALINHINAIHATYGKLGITPTQTQVLPEASTKITAFTSAEGVRTTASSANDKITVLHSGRYLCTALVSLAAGSGSSSMVLAIRVNNTTEVGSIYAVVDTAISSATVAGEVQCEAGDEIELYESGGQDGVTFTFHRLQLNVKRVG